MKRQRALAIGLAAVATAALIAGGLGLHAVRRATTARETLRTLREDPRRTAGAWSRRERGSPEPTRAERVAFGAALGEEAAKLVEIVPSRGLDDAMSDAGAPSRGLFGRGSSRSGRSAWLHVLATATDERLPDPPSDVREWIDEHDAELRRLAALVRESPPVAWDEDPRLLSPAFRTANRLRDAFVMTAGVDVWRGRHDAADGMLVAAWALQEARAADHPVASLNTPLLGALRCARVPDPVAWRDRIGAFDARRRTADDLLAGAQRRLDRTEIMAAREVPSWLPAPFRHAAIGITKLPRDWDAAREAEHAAMAVRLLDRLGPCDDPAALVSKRSKRDLLVAEILPAPASLKAARVLLGVEQEEALVELGAAVLDLRAGGTLEDPCGRFGLERSMDGRATLRWLPERHELAGSMLPDVRSFTFDASLHGLPLLATAPGSGFH